MNNNLAIFEKITIFIDALHEVFKESESVKSINLYHHLLNKTTISHKKAIKKHVSEFRKFCKENQEAISNKNVDLLTRTKIEYSEKVHIDIKEIFSIADTDTTDIIWLHLINMSYTIDPTLQTKNLLESIQNTPPSNDANALIDNIIESVSDSMSGAENVEDVIKNITQNGVLNNITGMIGEGIENKTLSMESITQKMMTMMSGMQNKDNPDAPDLGQMLGPVMNMMSGMQNKDNPDAPDLGQMLGPLLNMMGNTDSDSGEIPDLSNMLGPMMNMMSNNNNQQDGMPELSEMFKNTKDTTD